MKNDNGQQLSLTQALDLLKSRQGKIFKTSDVNLAELERLTGITRARLRRLKKHDFKEVPHGSAGKKLSVTVLSGYTGLIDNLLKQNVTNSEVCFERLKDVGYKGGISTVKNYIASHRHLVPAKRQLVTPQGNRGRRYITGPGEAYQMDWGFVHVHDYSEIGTTQAACFAMICHHCGQRYVEFFPNAKQENLFIGMLHAFYMLGVPKYVLTDNMKSVVIRRDLEGKPVWQKDYESFMYTVGFRTKLCKPRHPFTKGKVERLIRFVKDNFLAGRCFWNLSDLNDQALEWCNKHNARYHKEIDDIPDLLHSARCSETAAPLQESRTLLYYLCPMRRISFDGFVNYEGRRFGVPFRYSGQTVRVCRKNDVLYIYTPDLRETLVTHDVTWSMRDRYCSDQFFEPEMPEELPTSPVTTSIRMLTEQSHIDAGFEKFNFDEEVVHE
jgi:transposase